MQRTAKEVLGKDATTLQDCPDEIDMVLNFLSEMIRNGVVMLWKDFENRRIRALL